jgi:hypothetical protein
MRSRPLRPTLAHREWYSSHFLANHSSTLARLVWVKYCEDTRAHCRTASRYATLRSPSAHLNRVHHPVYELKAFSMVSA